VTKENLTMTKFLGIRWSRGYRRAALDIGMSTPSLFSLEQLSTRIENMKRFNKDVSVETAALVELIASQSQPADESEATA
jgi:hypothetical protein